MLTSKSITPHVVPGICKTLEKFLLIYRLDDILSSLGVVSATIGAGVFGLSTLLKSTGGKYKIYEHQDLIYEQNQKWSGAVTPSGQKVDTNGNLMFNNDGSPTIDPKYKSADPYAGAKSAIDLKNSIDQSDKEKIRSKKDALQDLQNQVGVQNINFPQSNTLNIEPTWASITTKTGASMIIGIKVIVFPIDSDQNIVYMMSQDLLLKGFERVVKQYSRKVARSIFSLTKHIPFIGTGEVITDSPEKAVLWGKTEHGRNIFMCLNYSDINNSEMILTATSVVKLFKMGWSSFVVSDDINKRAIFCIREFKGICSTYPYQYLFTSISKDANKVYNDVDDIRKSASPFFRAQLPMKKVFGESVAYQKLDKYLKKLYRS